MDFLNEVSLDHDSQNEKQDSDAGFVSLGENCKSLVNDPRGKIGCSTTLSGSFADPHASLEERERQLRAKELELQNRERQIKSESGNGNMIPMQKEKELNWPHPKFAYFHHDIEGEILEMNQSLVRIAYLGWKLMAFGYLFNFVTISVAAFHGHYYESGYAMSNAVFSALMYGGFATATSFLLWYYGGIYKLCRKSRCSAKRWMLFKVAFICHIVFSVLILMGAPWSFPSAGILFVMTTWFSGQTLSAVLGSINVLIWAAVVLNSLVVLRVATKFRDRTDDELVVETSDIKDEIRNAVAAMVMP